MKVNLQTLVMAVLFMFAISSCSQRYGYISKVKAPKKGTEERVAKQRSIQQEAVALNPEVEESLEPEISTQENTRSAVVALPTDNTAPLAETGISKSTTPKASVVKSKINANKGQVIEKVTLFSNERHTASKDNMQIGKDMPTVIKFAILGLAAILLALILNIHIIYLVGSILLLIALIILILILIEE